MFASREHRGEWRRAELQREAADRTDDSVWPAERASRTSDGERLPGENDFVAQRHVRRVAVGMQNGIDEMRRSGRDVPSGQRIGEYGTRRFRTPEAVRLI